MKRGLLFTINTLIIGLLISHSTTSDTGYQLNLINPMEEPIFLSICGIALMLFGLHQASETL